MLLNIVLLVIGFLLLLKGADWLVDGTSSIASKLGIPQLVIGLTIVAMGTSAPEAAVSITSAMKGVADIAVGNVVGSNILNVLIILGVTSIITPLALKANTIKYEIPFMIAISVIFAIIGLNNNILGWLASIILLGLFAIYLLYLFYMTKKGLIEEDEIEIKDRPILLLIFLSIIGVVAVVYGSELSVEAASKIASSFGVSERVIGLTIVALGTSLPELVTSVTAALRKNADIAIGNIVGSNIFNILFVIGISAAITPIPYQAAFIIDSIVCIVAGILLYVLVLNKDHQLKRYGGIILLVGYAAYLVYLMR